MSKKIPSEKISKQFGRAIKRLGERIPTNQPKQSQDMSKEKTFDEKFDEKFTVNKGWLFKVDDQMRPVRAKFVKVFFRQEILKVINSFEVEEWEVDTLAANPFKWDEKSVEGHNYVAEETNSRVKELRKEYEENA